MGTMLTGVFGGRSSEQLKRHLLYSERNINGSDHDEPQVALSSALATPFPSLAAYARI